MRQSIGNTARFFTEGISLKWSMASISQRLCDLMETLERTGKPEVLFPFPHSTGAIQQSSPHSQGLSIDEIFN